MGEHQVKPQVTGEHWAPGFFMRNGRPYYLDRDGTVRRVLMGARERDNQVIREVQELARGAGMSDARILRPAGSGLIVPG